MRQAAVGFQCPSCVSEGARSTRSGQATYGGAPSANPALTSQVLIAINAAVWILILATGGGLSPWVHRLALLPDSRGALVAEGRVMQFTGVADGAYWQLLTAMFTHVELWHVGFNMLALWIFGPQLESVLGRARFLALYLLSGLVGSAFVYWLAPVNSETLGASGAIFGLFGGFLLVAVKMRRNVSQMLVLLGINAFITFTVPNVSWQGHLGGFVGGALISAILVYAPRRGRGLWQSLGLGLIAVLLVLAFAVRTLALA